VAALKYPGYEVVFIVAIVSKAHGARRSLRGRRVAEGNSHLSETTLTLRSGVLQLERRTNFDPLIMGVAGCSFQISRMKEYTVKQMILTKTFARTQTLGVLDMSDSSCTTASSIWRRREGSISAGLGHTSKTYFMW
jgi:hypothetical protein